MENKINEKKIMNSRPLEILLVEDNQGDIVLTREGFKESQYNVSLNVAEDGEEALAYLNQEGQFKNARRPDLVLLDLNIPKLDGFEVLSRIKTSEKLKSIPVAVLTTSKATEDVVKSYALQANCFINKPVDMENFSKMIKKFRDFWSDVVLLPP